MEKTTYEVPHMYADHHVLKVHEALSKLDGIEEIYASSAWKQIMVSFDPKKVKSSAIEKTLSDAGYPVGAGETPVLIKVDKIKRDPQWEILGDRVKCPVNFDVTNHGGQQRWQNELEHPKKPAEIRQPLTCSSWLKNSNMKPHFPARIAWRPARSAVMGSAAKFAAWVPAVW